MGDSMRSDCLPVAIVVLVYSFGCLLLNAVLLLMLWTFGERFTYVALVSTIICVSTIASIIQQLHYVISWRYTVIKGYEASLQPTSIDNPGFGVAGNRMDVVLFLIQFYCYNVASMLVLLWAVDLFQRCWGLHMRWLGLWSDRWLCISKVSAILLPIVTIVLMEIPSIVLIRPLYYVIVNIIIGISLSTGAILLILILYRYMHTRRILVRPEYQSAWWYAPGSNGSTGTATSSVSDSRKAKYHTRQARYDRSLITRFTVAFVFLAAFEVAIVSAQMAQNIGHSTGTIPTDPDLSKSGTMTTIAQFIPGVTASLAIFLIIGTTKPWALYKEVLLSPFKRRQSSRKETELTWPDTRTHDEAPLTFTEDQDHFKSAPGSHYFARSISEDDLGAATGDGGDPLPLRTTNPLRRHPTNPGFGRPIVPSRQLNRAISGSGPILPPVVLTSTTIEIETSSMTPAFASFRHDGGIFDGSSLSTTNVTVIPPPNLAHNNYDLGPEVILGPSFDTTTSLSYNDSGIHRQDKFRSPASWGTSSRSASNG